jgi:hypothetical protein
MKGQLEVSFQWVYVLIAGGAFLLMFFFVFKSCTESGDERAQGMSVRATANAISLAAWQEGSVNFTFAADVSCVGDVLTLQALEGTARSQLDQVPAFLPPRLAGKSNVVTREVALTQTGVPSIRLGNVVYALDERTRYYVQRSHETRLKHVLGNSPSIIYVDSFSNLQVPGGVETVVLVGDNLPAVTLPQTKAKVYGVTLSEPQAIFYTASNDRLGSPKVELYTGDYMMVGAVVAARPQTYRCAKENFARRTGAVLGIYHTRNENLAIDFQNIPDPRTQVCIEPLMRANLLIFNLIDGRSARLDDLSTATTPLMTHQRTLQGLGCPVIA